MQKQFRQFKPQSNLDRESLDLASQLNINVMKNLRMYRDGGQKHTGQTLAKQTLGCSYRDRRVIRSAIERNRGISRSEYQAKLTVQEQLVIQLKDQITQLQQQLNNISAQSSPGVRTSTLSSSRPRSASLLKTIRSQQVAQSVLNYKLSQMQQESAQLVYQNRINQLERQLENARQQIQVYKDSISEKSYQVLIDLKDNEIESMQGDIAQYVAKQKVLDEQLLDYENKLFELQQLTKIYKKQIDGLTAGNDGLGRPAHQYSPISPDKQAVSNEQAKILQARQVMNDLNTYIKIVEDLRYKVKQQQETVDSKESICQQLLQEVRKLSMENKSKDEDIFRLNKDFKNNYDGVKKQQEVVQQMQLDMEKKELEYEELKIQLENMQNALNMKQARVVELEQINEEKGRQIIQLKESDEQMDTLRREVEEVNDQIAELKHQNSQKADKIDELIREIGQKDLQIKQLGAQLAGIQSQFNRSPPDERPPDKVDNYLELQVLAENRKSPVGQEESSDGFDEPAVASAGDVKRCAATDAKETQDIEHRYESYMGQYAQHLRQHTAQTAADTVLSRRASQPSVLELTPSDEAAIQYDGRLQEYALLLAERRDSKPAAAATEAEQVLCPGQDQVGGPQSACQDSQERISEDGRPTLEEPSGCAEQERRVDTAEVTYQHCLENYALAISGQSQGAEEIVNDGEEGCVADHLRDAKGFVAAVDVAGQCSLAESEAAVCYTNKLSDYVSALRQRKSQEEAQDDVCIDLLPDAQEKELLKAYKAVLKPVQHMDDGIVSQRYSNALSNYSMFRSVQAQRGITEQRYHESLGAYSAKLLLKGQPDDRTVEVGNCSSIADVIKPAEEPWFNAHAADWAVASRGDVERRYDAALQQYACKMEKPQQPLGDYDELEHDYVRHIENYARHMRAAKEEEMVSDATEPAVVAEGGE